MNQTNEIAYKKLFENIYKYVYFRVGNKHEAEDITSETVARILEKKDLSNVENINYFAIGIARNIMMDTFNKNKKSVNLEATEQFDVLHEDISLDESVLNSEMIELVKSELKNLDEVTAEIITLKVWQDLKFNQIAELVGHNENSVRTLFYRGVESLKFSLNKPKSNYRAYSFTLPIILAGAKAIFATNEFAAAGSFISGLISKALSLNIIIPTMATIETTTVVGAKTAGGFLSTTSAKIVAVLIGSGTILGGGFVVASLPSDKNSQPNKIEVENIVSHAGTQVEEIPLKEFKSQRYDVSFKYPSEMGDTTVKFHPEYFNNEGVVFSNAKIGINYNHIEGGFFSPNDVTLATVTTKQGYPVSIRRIIQGVDKDQYGVMAMVNDDTPGAVISLLIISQGLTTLEEVDVVKDQMITILETMELDLSKPYIAQEGDADCKMKTFTESTFRNFTFDYDACEWEVRSEATPNNNIRDSVDIKVRNLKDNSALNITVSRRHSSQYTGNLALFCGSDYRVLLENTPTEYGLVRTTSETYDWQTKDWKYVYGVVNPSNSPYGSSDAPYGSPEKPCVTNFGALFITEPGEGNDPAGLPNGKIVSAFATIPDGLNLSQEQLIKIDDIVMTFEMDGN